jgi:hypothetical protein
VHYLFETVTSKSFRYTRIIDSVRKVPGEPPFAEKAGQSKPRIHWINFWDRADVASSALYTPANCQFHPDQVVDNCEVAGKCFPDPASAHSDYIKNPVVLRGISEAFFDNRHNFVGVSKAKNVNYQEHFIGGNERKHWFTNVFQAFVLLLPWLTLLYLFFRSFNTVTGGSIALWSLGLCFFSVVAFAFLDWFLRFRRNDAPVSKRPPSRSSSRAEQAQ